MVDGGSSGTVIRFRPPRDARNEEGFPSDQGSPQPDDEDRPRDELLLSLPFLRQGLGARSDAVKMWATYHLVDRWQPETEQFIELLWGSSVPEIRESAVNLIGKYRIDRYAFPLLRAFTANESGLRSAAAIALGRLGYEAAGKPLLDWFERLMASHEPKIPDLESAAESLLLLDAPHYWEHLYGRLERSLQNHSVFITLFRLLCRYARDPELAERIAIVYGGPREIYHDFHLTQILVELVGRPGISRYLQSRLNGGYPLPAIYQECFRLLGCALSDPQTRQLLEAMEECRNDRAGATKFLTISSALIARLAPESEGSRRIQAFLKGCLSWIPRWEEAILKVREIEYHLLLSLPLVALLQRAEEECLAFPAEEALRISRIYQSPLLSPEFMRRILLLLASRDYPRERVRLGSAAMGGWIWDEEKDTLWKLFTDQLEEIDYPFEQVLPQPWAYQLPELLTRLGSVLASRFESYLQSGRRQAVDYALEVFQYEGSLGMVETLVTHFEPLLNHHYHQFIELMTHLPDRRFLEPLLAHYREGEYDLARLIRFLCDVHALPPPAVLEQEKKRQASPPPVTTVRLSCPACGRAYQYGLHTVYVNEECLEQRQVPDLADIWCPQSFRCKNCEAAVPFQPDEAFRNDLYAELAATRILQMRPGGAFPVSPIRMIAFPVWERRTQNPAEFLARAPAVFSKRVDSVEAVQYLFALGRFYLEIGEWGPAKQALEKILAGPIKFPRALYYLGVIAFQEKNLYEARLYFSRLIDSSNREEFERELDNPIDMAHHYLKLLDKREFKRSHFQLISS